MIFLKKNSESYELAHDMWRLKSLIRTTNGSYPNCAITIGSMFESGDVACVSFFIWKVHGMLLYNKVNISNLPLSIATHRQFC
jgi:hypothetical protein